MGHKRMKSSVLLKAWILSFSLLPISCKTLNNVLDSIIINAGAEYTSLDFLTHPPHLQGFPVRKFSDQASDTDTSSVSRDSSVTRAFYSIGSVPSRIPGTADMKGFFSFLSGLAWSFNLTSPRTYRGNLVNYPDDGRNYKTPEEYVTNQLFPLPGQLGRNMEYIYEDYQMYFTLYLGYYQGTDINFGIGPIYGVAFYRMDIIENERRISSVKNEVQELKGVRVLFEYNVGKFFPDTILYNAYFFTEITSFGDLDGKGMGIKNQVLTSNGLPAPSLYMTMTTYRMGIRKELQLSKEPHKKEEGPAYPPLKNLPSAGLPKKDDGEVSTDPDSPG
ncbi:LIC10647 family lipoprotein [Leptospira wolffii]|uniref:LIC10647 family lipoprotein n=1 Tax=Leptospira wolffii TaxID=409998 RepID=UPI001FF01F21|nr:hypothetical protein [Leptospira wolffii]